MTESTHANWHVTSQYETTEVMPGNQLVNGYKVLFVTGSGHNGSVFVPMAKYTVDSVRAMVQDAADLVDGVGNLSSGA